MSNFRPRLYHIVIISLIGASASASAQAPINSIKTTTPDVHQNTESIDIQFSGGSARVRGEYKNNLGDSNSSADDQSDSIGARIRLNILAKPNKHTHVFVQPQFSKTYGGPSTTTTGSATGSSGSLQDPRQDVHQAYIHYFFGEHCKIWAGRQELAYGNHLVLGNVGWSNVGRSFDALRFQHQFNENSKLDAIWSQIQEKATSTFTEDNEISGLYYQGQNVWIFDETDLYVLYSKNNGNTTPTPSSFTTYGTRLESSFNKFDVGLEVTGQTRLKSFQGDLELGYTSGKLRGFVGYSSAHKDYHQLYPTAHKFFGSADLIGRRNLEAYRLGLKSKLNEEMLVKLQYYSFSRKDKTAPIYGTSGSTVTGSTGSESGSAIANELDLSWKWNFLKKTHLEVGAAYLETKEYLKNVRGNDDSGSFAYIQTGVVF